MATAVLAAERRGPHPASGAALRGADFRRAVKPALRGRVRSLEAALRRRGAREGDLGCTAAFGLVTSQKAQAPGSALLHASPCPSSNSSATLHPSSFSPLVRPRLASWEKPSQRASSVLEFWEKLCPGSPLCFSLWTCLVSAVLSRLSQGTTGS